MRITKYTLTTAVITLGVIFLLVPVVTFAKQAQAQNGNSDSSTQNSNTSNTNSNTSSSQENSADSNGQGKLEGDNLKKCQTKETQINSIMARITDRGEKQLVLMSTISNRLQSFYKAKEYNISNYDELIANVNTTRLEAKNMVQAMIKNSNKFDCGSSDPKTSANSFKERAKSQNGALNEYKTAINNLLLKIKEVAITETLEVTE